MLARISRRAVLAMAGLGTALSYNGARAAVATPAQSSGPFYPPPAHRPGDTDWDLVKVAGQVREAGGEILHLFGQVLDFDGKAVPDALVEIWQCDVNGRYLHRGDNRADPPRDTGFQGYGAIRTDSAGNYRFRTIRPVAYPGRTPHIHARVVPPSGRELVTQIYVVDDPLNERDWIFNSLGPSQQAAVSIDPVMRANGALEAGFNFVL